MSDSFDPYLAWLNIPSGPRPPDHYALLGIKQFEDSSDVILQAAEAQLAKIRTVRPGENVRDWGQLLDELDGVKGCLLDPQRKSVYDQELGRAADPAAAASAPEASSQDKDSGVGSPTSGANAIPTLAAAPTMARPPGSPNTVSNAATPAPATTPNLATPPGAASPPAVTPVQATIPNLAAPPGAASPQPPAEGPAVSITPASSTTPNLAMPPSAASPEPPTEAPAVSITPASSATPNLAAPPGAASPEPPAGAPDAFTSPTLATTVDMDLSPPEPARTPADSATPNLAAPPGAASPEPADAPTAFTAPTLATTVDMDLAPPEESASSAGQGVPESYGLRATAPLGELSPTSAEAQPEIEKLLVAQPVPDTGDDGMMSTPDSPRVPVSGPILPRHSDQPPELLLVSQPTQPAPLEQATAPVGRSLMRWVVTGALMMSVVVLGGILIDKLNPSSSEDATAENGNSPAEAPKEPPPLDPLPPPLVDPLPMGIDPSPPPLLPSPPPLNPSPPEQPAQPVGPPLLTTNSPPPMLDPSQPTPSLPLPTPVPPNPTPVPPPPPSPSPPGPAPRGPFDPQKEAVFARAVADARAAMSGRDLAAIGPHLKTAAQNAQTNENQVEIARLEVLQHNLNEFWEGVREGVAALNNVGDMPFGDTRVAIVEADRDHIVLRAYGRNKRFKTMEMPYDLILIVANRWFSKEAPSTKAIIGTFIVVDKQGNREHARQLWQQATREGVDCRDLMPELDIATRQ